MGFEEDLLNREKYANFLTEIIGNPQKYKRIGDTNSMSIAIDSGWGTGKTTFIEMWSHKLNENFSDDFFVIKYNAWKNDFIDNPFESIIYSIYNSEIFKEFNEKEIIKEEEKSFLEAAIKLTKATGKFALRKWAGEELSEAVGDFFDEFTKGAKDAKNIKKSKEDLDSENFEFYEAYKDYNNAIEELKNNLEKVTKDRKIIVFIDELDRCKPTFAIKLLENVKHIFDVKNLIFVFALDMEQLGHSIKSVYGQGMDANGYLCRFFDYVSKMPKGSLESYIEYIVKENVLIRNSFIDEQGKSIKFEQILLNMSNIFKLSLRDIDTIYTNFRVFESLELKNTTSMHAYSLYLFLIILKYKNLYLYNKIFIYHEDNQDIKNEVFANTEMGKFIKHNIISSLITNMKIKDIEFEFKYTSGKTQFVSKLLKIEDEKLFFNSRNSSGFMSSMYLPLSDIGQDITASYLLFYDDMLKCNEIINKKMGDYIQEKLEIFNFEVENKSAIKEKRELATANVD